MMSTPLLLLIIILCILGEAFFAGAEIGLISIDRITLRHRAKLGHKASIRVQELLKHPEWLLGTTLVGTNLCVALNTTLTTSLFYHWFGADGIIYAILTLTFVSWIFAEIIPKSLFQHYANSLAPRISFLLYLMSIVLYPLVWFFSKAGSIIAALLGGKFSTNLPFITRDEIKLLMKVIGEKSDIKTSERKMIDRLLSFKDLTAYDVMVPLIKVIAINEQATIQEARTLIARWKHRRLPVYRERIDQISGILNSFDILGEELAAPIKSYIRPAVYVPSNMKVTTLLEQFQKSGNNMAIVVDEYGGAEGIVTIEDILEEIVGEIGDEYDLIQPHYRVQRDASIVVSGQTDIREINERFNLDIPEGEYETISGFLMQQMQKIPQVGECYRVKDSILTVTRATPSAVLEIKIKRASS
jgi:CBS domain containing-hemolysin-like protein